MQNSNPKLFLGLILGVLLGAGGLHLLRPPQAAGATSGDLDPLAQPPGTASIGESSLHQAGPAQGLRKIADPKARGLREASIPDQDLNPDYS